MESLILQDGDSLSLSRNREFTERYVAIMESPLDDEADILSDSRMFLPGDPHPTLQGFFVSDVDADQDEECPIKWDLTVEYSNDAGEAQENQAQATNPNPINRPARISWGSIDATRITTVDNKGKPILNTAGDLIEEIEREDSNLVIRVEKDIAKAPTWLLRYLGNPVNNDAVRIENLIFKPDTLKLRNLARSSVQEDNGFKFFTLSFDLHHNPLGWTARILNRGFNEVAYSFDKNSYVKQRILIQGDYPNEPQFLDKDGRWIDTAGFGLDEQGGVIVDEAPNGTPIRGVPEPSGRTPADIVVLKKQLEPRLPFRVLPLK